MRANATVSFNQGSADVVTGMRRIMPPTDLRHDDPVWQTPIGLQANCLSLVFNRPDWGASTPGTLKRADNPPYRVTVDILREKLLEDGHEAVSEPCDGYIFAAYATHENYYDPDFHFLGRDIKGIWFGKARDAHIRLTDNFYDRISDPAKAKMGPYRFAGYFRFPAQGLLYLPTPTRP